jgi:hypothetical protein
LTEAVKAVDVVSVISVFRNVSAMRNVPSGSEGVTVRKMTAGLISAPVGRIIRSVIRCSVEIAFLGLIAKTIRCLKGGAKR